MLVRRLAGWLVLLCLPIAAHGYEYPVPLDGVQAEDDLRELSFEGQLDEEELERLIAIFNDPVDLNEATRDELYDLPALTWPMVDAIIADREANGRFQTVEALVRVDGVSPHDVRELLPFAHTPAEWKLEDVLRAKLDIKTAWRLDRPDEDVEGSAADDVPPTTTALLRAEVDDYLHIGVGIVTGREIADPDLQTVVAGQPLTYDTEYEQRFDLAKVYVHTPRTGQPWSVIAGSYRIGFGMGTIIDNTGRDLPDGWRPDNDFSHDTDVVGSPPVRHRDAPRFFGVAAALNHLDAGGVFLSAQGFASVVDRNSYGLIGRAPDDDDDEPESIKLVEDETSRTQNTILDAFRETTAGGHFAAHLGPRTEVGATAWWGKVDFLLEPEDDLAFKRSARYPRDPSSFGAFGAHAFVELTEDVTLRGELGRTLAGGNAAWVRGFYDTGPLDTELALRWYDVSYANPYASPSAQADQLNGHRARDEKGVLWRISWKQSRDLELRLKGDVWQRAHAHCDLTDAAEREADCDAFAAIPEEQLKSEEGTFQRHEASAVWRPTRDWRLQIKPTYAENDEEGSEEEGNFTETGAKFDLFGKVDYDALDWLRISVAYRHRWEDDDGPKSVFDPDCYDPDASGDPDPSDDCTPSTGRVDLGDPGDETRLFDDEKRQDYYVWLELLASLDRTRASIRYKHNEAAVGHATHAPGDGSYDQVSFRLRQLKTAGRVSASFRYDFLRFSDDRQKWFVPSPDDPDVPNATRNHHLLVANATLFF